jgi:hypothetical protein
VAEPIYLKCPSCDQILAGANESVLVSVLQEHLYEEHALEMPRERVRENVSAQLKISTATMPVPSAGPKS